MTLEAKPKKGKRFVFLIIAGGLLFLCAMCGIFSVIMGSTPTAKATATARALRLAAEVETPAAKPQSAKAALPTNTSNPTNPPKPTNTPKPTATLRPTNTPKATNTPKPPTATPNPNLIRPGTYLVGTDIKPGIYKGQAGSGLLESCYWARLKDLSGSFDALSANDNSIGQFYVELKDSDYAFETKCPLVRLSALPEPPAIFPKDIVPGTYLVGIDLQSGTYKGQTGTEITESCYWSRLSNVSGDMNSIIANDNAIGQFYVQIQPSDFALSTKCELERVGN